MQWADVRARYPEQWLVIEALEAHTTPEGERQLDGVVLVEQCRDGSDAFACYRRLHQQYPYREFYFVHTERAALDIRERRRVGVRPWK